mmetsp:Transcript_6126/g.8938  ORF Transcript_6126/g.8938 Transcript_6126/m.8938 type:complete len:91 (-) Transcript_6126:2670-2942(-)
MTKQVERFLLSSLLLSSSLQPAFLSTLVANFSWKEEVKLHFLEDILRIHLVVHRCSWLHQNDAPRIILCATMSHCTPSLIVASITLAIVK